MRANKILSLVITLLGLQVIAAPYSDHGMGNGGDAVVCYTDATRSTITSVQMLDYWEQEQVVKYGKIDLGAVNLSVQDKIQIAVNRIAKFDPDLAEKIKFNALNLADNIQNYLVTSYQLPEINDANPQVIPTQKNCYIEQYGVQFKDVITGQRRFVIADKFYNFAGTSTDDKAGLLLHEAIYRYAILQNSALNNSDGVRYFNYVVASTRIDGMTLDSIDDYVSFLRSAGIENSSCIKTKNLFYQRNNYTCYNQVVFLNKNVKINIPNKNGFDTNRIISDPADQFDVIRFENGPWSSSQKPTIEINSVKFKTKNTLILDLKLSEVEFNFYEKPLDYLYLADGPGHKTYKCDIGLRFNYKIQYIQSCMTTDVINMYGQNFQFGEVERMGADRWSIRNISLSSFEVLGTKKKLNIVLSSNIASIIDTDLHAVSGHTNSTSRIDIGGFNYVIDRFSVIDSTPNRTFIFNSSGETFIQPKLKGMRMIYYNNYQSIKNGIKQFCMLKGLDNGDFNMISEYINGLGESFYDLTNDTVVYKTDENVEYVDKITCSGKYNLNTSDY